jgi:hypothetical protein
MPVGISTFILTGMSILLLRSFDRGVCWPRSLPGVGSALAGNTVFFRSLSASMAKLGARNMLVDSR